MVKIKSIQEDGYHLTYDIHNKANSGDNGNFVIDGKIVHNSILANGVERFEDLLFFNAAGHPGPMQCCWSHSKIDIENDSIEINQLNHTTHLLKCYTMDGHIKYTSKYKVVGTGKKKLKKITLSDGRVVIVTDEHRLGVEGGYKYVKDLKVGDKLISDD